LKIDFQKIGKTPRSVTIEKEGVTLSGELRNKEHGLTDFKGKLSNNIKVQCAKCGEEFLIDLDEDLTLKFSDGIYKGSDPEADVIEFYDGKIDFEEVLISEIESIRADYHICPNCKEGENNGST